MRLIRHAGSVAIVTTMVGCGGQPLAPATPTVPIVVAPLTRSLRITSPASVVQKTNIAYMRTAEVVTSEGAKPCSTPAVWTVDDAKVAGVDNPDGLFYARESGYAMLTASCDGLTTSLQVRVEAPAAVTTLWVKDGTSSLRSVGATAELLDGPRAGTIVLASQFYTLDPATFIYPVKVRISARLFADKTLVLSGSTSDNALRNLYSTKTVGPGGATFTVELNYVGEPGTDSYLAPVLPANAVYPFRTGASGNSEIQMNWVNDDPSHWMQMTTELWCNGQRLALDQDRTEGFNASVRIRQSVPAQSACEVRVAHDDFIYRVAITYPH